MSLRLIQVGLGHHGRGVGHHYVMKSPDFKYAGLVDLDRASMEGFATEHSISDKLLYTDYHEAFRELAADAVLIEAASPIHYDVCRAALNNGLHVLVEKPFTLSMDHARELVRIADEKKLNIMVNQNYRYYSSVLTFKHTMRNSAFGKPLFINAQFYYDHDGKPYQRKMEDYILFEMSIHHVDMIRFLTDSNIVSVRGTTWNDPESGYAGDPHVQAFFRTASGIPVTYLASLRAKGIPIPWEGVWSIHYEQGAIYLDDLGEGFGVYTIDAERNCTKLPPVEPEKESIHGILAEFAASIRDRREPAISGRDNMHTLSALFATSRSSREGKEIKVSQVL